MRMARLGGRTFASLRHRDYRLYFAGSAVSFIGTWMQQIAAFWLVLDLTHSPVAVGALALVQTLPVTVFSLVGGSLADRVDVRYMLVASDCVMTVVAGTLAVLALTGAIEVWQFYALGLVYGIVVALGSTSRHTLVFRIVGRDEQASTSFFYLGVVGWLFTASVGPFYLTPVEGHDWVWFGIISITSIISHYLLILAYNRLDAIQIQPISYFQLVWASMLGVVIFSETLHLNVLVGSMIVVGAGLFTIWRAAIRRQEATRGFK